MDLEIEMENDFDKNELIMDFVSVIYNEYINVKDWVIEAPYEFDTINAVECDCVSIGIIAIGDCDAVGVGGCDGVATGIGICNVLIAPTFPALSTAATWTYIRLSICSAVRGIVVVLW